MDVTFYLNGTVFVWDDNKAASNLADHGVTFEKAAETFFDPFAKSKQSSIGTPKANHGEHRAHGELLCLVLPRVPRVPRGWDCSNLSVLRFSYGDASPAHEKRDYIIGYTFDRDLLFTVYLERGPRVRLSSACEAMPRERRLYERGE